MARNRKRNRTSYAPTTTKTIQRGFADNPELLNEGSKFLAIEREDTIEVPAVTSLNPFQPIPQDVLGADLIGESAVVSSQANLMLEYLASIGPSIALQFGAPTGITQGAGIHVLPIYIDQLERDLGIDIYRRMMYDSAVKSKTEAFIDGILDRPIQISPGVEGEEEDDETAEQKHRRKFATEVSDFIQANLDRVHGGFHIKLREMLDGIPMGYKLGEKIYEVADVGNGPQTCLQGIAPKPQEAASIVADMYNTVLGYLPRLRGTGILGSFLFGNVGVSTVNDPSNPEKISIPDLIPPEKIWHFTWMPLNDSPLGQSHLRAAYIPWRLKIGLYPAYEAYLARFAQPSVALELGGGEIPAITGKNGKLITNPADIVAILLYNLRQWQAGGAMVAPLGKVVMQESKSEGDPYLKAFSLCNDEITTSILHTNLTTQSAKVGTQALADVHQDTEQLLFALGKVIVAQSVRDGIVHDLVYYNYGQAGLDVMPRVSFGETAQQDLSAIGSMVAALKQAGIFFPPQYNDAFRQLHIQELDNDTIKLLTDMWLKTLEQQATMMDQQAAQGQIMIDQAQSGAAAPGGPPGAGNGPGGATVPGKGGAGVSGQGGGSQGKVGADGKPAKQEYYGD